MYLLGRLLGRNQKNKRCKSERSEICCLETKAEEQQLAQRHVSSLQGTRKHTLETGCKSRRSFSFV